MAKRRSPKRRSTRGGATGDTASAVTGESNISQLTAKAIDKTKKLPDQIVKRHEDKSLYVLLLILSLFCVNLYFFVKNVKGNHCMKRMLSKIWAKMKERKPMKRTTH